MMRLAGLLGILGLGLGACESWPMKPNVLFREMGGGCTRNADCSSGLCVDYQTGPYAPGSCVPESAIVYVDLDRCSKTDMGQMNDMGSPRGTISSPFCQINDALLNRAQNANKQIFLVRSSNQTYNPISSSSMPVGSILSAIVVGPWADPALRGLDWTDSNLFPPAIVDGSGIGPAVEVYEPTSITLDGFQLRSLDTAAHVVICNGRGNKGRAELSIRRTTITGSKKGGCLTVAAQGQDSCDIRVDRALMQNCETGLAFISNANVSNYLITNSKFVNNVSGVQLASVFPGFSGKFQYNSVVSNRGAGSIGIACLNGSLVENSIFIGNSTINGSQQQGCKADQSAPVVVGATDKAGEDFSTKDPDLTSDFKLKPTSANLECCIDKVELVVPRDSPLKFDFFGNPRPQNGKADVGFHELIP